MKAKETEFVVFDVETTGFYPQEGDRIIEIAAVKVKNGATVDVFDSLINPERPLSAEAQKINQITDEMVKDAPKAPEVLPRMIDFIGGACLVGHNVKFDMDFLCYELSTMGRRLREETPAVDTLKIAKYVMPHLTSYRLDNIARSLGVQVNETHRALADVELTVAVLNRLLDAAYKQNIITFQDIHREFCVPKPVFRIEEVSQGFLF